MDKQEARRWIQLFGDLPDELRHPCRKGHRECSTVYHGECLDDVLQAGVVNVDPLQPVSKPQPTEPSA